MSKENAIKFLEFLGKHPEVVQEGKKYDDGKTDMYVIANKVAKDKGYECTAKEIKEAMEMVKKDSSEMGEDDLANVAGGANVNEIMTYIDKGSDIFIKLFGASLENADKIMELNKKRKGMSAGSTPGTPAGQ